MNNNYYGRPYMPNNSINQHNMYEQIDNQINQLQQMKEQMRNNQQPAINQTFQLAPTHSGGMRYANTIDDVNKESIYYDTPFFSKDMSIVWIKNAKGDIKTYELSEIIPKDEKDIQIEYLQSQIEELKGMINNEQPNTNVDAEQTTTNTTGDDETTREPIKKNEPTSVQKVSRSKKEQQS